MKLTKLSASLVSVCGLTICGLTLAVSNLAFANAILLRGGDVYTVSDGIKPATDVLIVDGKIAEIAKDINKAEAQVVDVSGKRVYPGLVHANTVAGLTEISAVRATNDFAEVGPINPNVRAQTVINPDSELLPVIRAQGVTTLHVGPQGGAGAITGISTVVQPIGWTIEDMRLRAEAGMYLQWPSARAPDFLPAFVVAEIKKAAGENLKALQKAIDDAHAYQLEDRAKTNQTPDLRWQAMLPVLTGERKLFVVAEDVTQIRQSLQFCSKNKLRCVLVGAVDAWRVPAEIKAAGVEIVLGSPFNLPLRRSEGFDVVYENASKLAKFGLTFAIAGDGSSFAAPLDGNLAFNAAQYLNFGLSDELALRAITLTPAEILGVADRVGSISVGKQADLLIMEGDVFEPASKVAAVYLRGQALDLSSRHTRLRDKYQGKLGQ